jgi:hypothetical protein
MQVLEGESKLMDNKVFTAELQDAIMKIVKKGNSAEIKKENNKLVLVEIERRVRNKTSITG